MIAHKRNPISSIEFGTHLELFEQPRTSADSVGAVFTTLPVEGITSVV
jgi:hypothetical protein